MREPMRLPVTLRTGKTLIVTLCVTALQGPSFGLQPGSRAASGERGLSMSQAVVCRSIEGFEKYERLPGATMTSDEKLLLYFRPTGYKTAMVDGKMQAHFTEDAQIRRRDDKVVIRQQLKLLDYTAKFEDPSHMIFLRNSISLKGLPPGEYEFVVTLHDAFAKGSAAKQVVRFTVITAKDPSKGRTAAKSVEAAAEASPER